MTSLLLYRASASVEKSLSYKKNTGCTVGQTNYEHIFRSRRHIQISKYLHLLCQKSQKNQKNFPINLCQGAIQTWGLQPLNYYGWGPFFRLFYMVSFLWLFTPSKSWDNDQNFGLNFSLCYKLQLCFYG